jgi:hypothetical protein
MKFTERLYLETKEAHKTVDSHPFVSLIRTNNMAGELYINFNKICIYELQKTFKLNDVHLQARLYRDIEQPDIFINKSLNELLILCRQFPLELGYAFYLGLLFGGNILKKMIPNKDEHDFFSFENPKQLITEFKNYLDNNVSNHDEFISNVNEVYKLIKEIFDEFY